MPFALGLSVFTFVLLIARLLRLIEMVVTRGVPAGQILQLIAYIMPQFLEVTLPMAMLLAILVAFGRLSADSEVVALRSSGLSLYQLVVPVVLFVAFATLATGALAFYGRPWGNRALRAALYEIARTRASAGLKPQIFNDDFPGLVIYTEAIDATDNRLHNVLISDERDASEHHAIFAREAVMVPDPDNSTITLRLRNGFIHSTATRGAAYETDFESYDVNLDLRQSLIGDRRGLDAKEMTLPELRDAIADKQQRGTPFTAELVEYHRKFAIPFACVVFGLVAVPLGVQPVRAARARGFAVSLVMIFAYYVLLSGGQALAEQELVPAPLGLWLPNVAFAVLGVWLFVKAGREQSLLQFDWAPALIAGVRDKLSRVGAPAAP